MCRDKNKNIKLPNRDGIKTELRHVNDNIYTLFTELPYISVTYSDENKETIYSVDPPGGPFISIGDAIEGKTVKKIIHSIQLESFVIYFDI
jgi:hypothetical protein